MSSDTPSSWEQVLADLEADVEASAAALDAGTPIPASRWEVPTVGVPLPDALRTRAAALQQRLDTVQRIAARRHHELGGDLDALDRRRDAGAAYAAAGAGARDRFA